MEIQTVSSSQSWAHVTFHLTVPTLRKDSSFCSSPRVELLNLGTCPSRKSKAHVQGSHPDSQRQWTERHFQSVSEVVNVARAGLRPPCCFLCWLINRKTRVPPVKAQPACFPFCSIILPLPIDMVGVRLCCPSPFVSHISALVFILCFVGESEFLCMILKTQTGICREATATTDKSSLAWASRFYLT